jgi:AAA domain
MTAQATTATKTPIEKVLDRDPRAKDEPNASGWHQTICPAHNDKNRSLSFRAVVGKDGNEGVIFHCFAGCTRQAILDAYNFTETDLSTRASGKAPRYPSNLTLIDLAIDKHLHWQFLFRLEVFDIEKKGVKIPYFTMEGKPYERYRVRTQATAKQGIYWNTESQADIIPYGLQRLEDARKAKQLTLVEGESDCWTLWFHQFPALGLPGASMVKSLQGEYFTGIETVYIIQEPGTAGQKFPLEIKKRLDEVGYKGKIYAVNLWNEFQVKDPNDLHKKDSKAFKASFETALLRAKPLHKVISKLTTHRLCDLQGETLPDTRWAIDPILPEGVTILGGKPKLGKSWFALSILLAIAAGGAALSQYPVERGQVLYISLEDNKKRLQKRSNIVLQNALASPDFEYVTECARINEGGYEQLEGWIVDHPRARLICIDTWARFKPKMHGGRQNQQYDEDYEALAPLQEMAARYSVSILIVDHMRKMESEDPIDMISGSVGKAGAVDGFLLLYRKRGETDARLLVTGRDIEEEQELLLTFMPECASWVIRGNADDTTLASTPQQQEILDELVKHEQGLTVKALAERLSKNVNTTRNLLQKLRNSEKVILQNNVYSVVTHSNHSKSSKDSKSSNPSDKADSGYYAASQLTTVLTTGVVTPEHHADEPQEPMYNGHSQEVTTLTMVTMDALEKRPKKTPIPIWLTPGTPEWEKEVKRSGLADVQARRAAALKEREAVKS